jgi:hypothetical protein
MVQGHWPLVTSSAGRLRRISPGVTMKAPMLGRVPLMLTSPPTTLHER